MKLFHAYVAGLFDGEGCILVRLGSGRGGVLRVMVYNTYKEVLEKIQNEWGGDIFSNLNENTGFKSKRRVYVWSTESRAVIDKFLSDIFQHLIVKRLQVEVAFEYLEFKNDSAREGRRMSTQGRPLKPEILIKEKEFYTRLRDLKRTLKN